MEKIPEDSILPKADVVGLYPSIPHNAGVEVLKDALDCKQNKWIPTDTLVKTTELVLANNQCEFGQKVFHQNFGTAIGTKFAPPYACIFWFRYIDDLFFILTYGKEELESFVKELKSFSDHVKFTFEFNKENTNFLDVNINLSIVIRTRNIHISIYKYIYITVIIYIPMYIYIYKPKRTYC